MDLNLGMTRSNIVFTLTDFLLRGSVETATGNYMVTPLSQTELPSALLDKSSNGDDDASSVFTSDTDQQPEERTYVALDCLYHPNLGSMQYGSFFNLCRLHGVSFDLQQRTGTAFMLTDSLTAGIVGLIGVGKDTESAYGSVNKSLRFIESQTGSMREANEFDSEKSNFVEISNMIKQKVAAFKPVAKGGH